MSSSTRGIIAGGQNPAYKNEINFITISTLGNAADFGDLTVARRTLVGGSNAIRGLFLVDRIRIQMLMQTQMSLII